MNRKIQQFQDVVWGYHDQHGRSMPWRNAEPDGSFSAYKILVSELMLQQTQVARVIPKFESFIAAFPTHDSLASASLQDVLAMWTGLGYSRRAKYLHDIARSYEGRSLPDCLDELVSNKGIGHNTAAAILTYVYDQKYIFVETNIRTIYIHHFFTDASDVNDTEITRLVDESLPNKNYRTWYWALMDYGTYLKKSGVKNNHRSKHYAKQSKFEGSLRQLRGKVLRELQYGSLGLVELALRCQDDRVLEATEQLAKDGLVTISREMISITP